MSPAVHDINHSPLLESLRFRLPLPRPVFRRLPQFCVMSLQPGPASFFLSFFCIAATGEPTPLPYFPSVGGAADAVMEAADGQFLA